MASEVTEAVVDGLTDFDQACELMEELGLDSDEMESLTDAKHALRLHLSRSRTEGGQEGQMAGRYHWTATNSMDIVQQLMRDNQASREKLQSYIHRVGQLAADLPGPRKLDLLAAYPSALEDIRSTVHQLDTEECVILVAGATSSGKSTLLNLLLGRLASDLLPVSLLSSTSVICEIKYGQRPMMKVFYKDTSKPPVEYQLTSNASAVISQHVHQKGAKRELAERSRVVISWPSEWLKGGVTIVDSPGVGESQVMTDMVKNYISKAFAFIYVIDASNAGGINPDRLQNLLFSHLAKQEEGIGGSFDPKSAIFVCNKWDEVGSDERGKVKKYVMDRLQETWPGFKEEQVFFISATQTMKELKDDYVSPDYVNLLVGIEKLIPVGLKSRLCKQYMTASDILKRCILVLKSFIFSGEATAEKVKQMVCTARAHLESLERRPQGLKNELRDLLNNLIELAIKGLQENLSDRLVVETLCRWRLSECPKSKDLEHLKELMRDYAAKRIKNHISEWDKDHRVFEKIHDQMLATFKRKFVALDLERQLIESSFSFGSERDGSVLGMLEGIRKGALPVGEDDIEFSTREKVIIGLSAPVWVPLGVVVGLFALPIMGLKALHQRHRDRKKLAKLQENISEEMEILTRELLTQMSNESSIKEMIQERLLQLTKSFFNMIDSIPRLIKADRDMLGKMEREVVINAEMLRDVYRPLYDEACQTQTYLDLLYVSDIRAYRIDTRDLTKRHYLGDGTFAKVYLGEWKKYPSRPPLKVALKVMKEELSSVNATELVEEEENLRNLQTANVVQFYGTAPNYTGAGVCLIFVMEYCEKTLDKLIYNPPYVAPGNRPDRESAGYRTAIKEAAGLCRQISCGLMAIHGRGYVHRDLKPENILVTESGTVKLADLGLAKRAGEITGTMCGTPLYMAPEVFKEQKYSEKADMFGFGMVMWELWFGLCVLIEYQVDNLDDFLRKPFPVNRQPDSTWKHLMKQCWSLEPGKRPTAHDVNRLISSEYLKGPARRGGAEWS